MMSITVPAGKYYLGDPCYCFDSIKWSKVLDDSHVFEDAYKEGHHVAFAFGTAHGDGVFYDQHDHVFPVDAGMIGLVNVNLANIKPEDMLMVTFTTPTQCFRAGSILTFGKYVIDTDPPDEDESEDYQAEEEEEKDEEDL